jgi:branched-chain amino acid transport system substrate-binding protein
MKIKTIKIGFPSGLSGVYAGIAKSQLEGVILAVDEWNKQGGVLGRQVEIVVKDDKCDPALTTALTRELIYKDKVDLIVGVLSAGTQLQANEETKKAKMFFMSLGMSDELTTAAYLGPYTFHQAPTVYMNDQAVAKWIFENLGKRWYLIAADYTWGWSHIEGYEAFASRTDAKIIGIKKVPFPAKEEDAFTRHFSEIIRKKPEVLIVNNAGADQQKFIKEAHKAGLKSKMSIVHTTAMLAAVNTLDPEEAVGMYWGSAFYWGLKDILPTSKKFVTAYQKKFKTLPCAYATYGYSGAMEALTAIEKTGKYPLDPNKMAKELEGRTFAHCKHPEWWRPCDHQAFQDFYVLKFKGPEERKNKDDSSEIVGQTSWDLDFGKSCQVQGQGKKMWGHSK